MSTPKEHCYFFRPAGDCLSAELSTEVVESLLTGVEPTGVSCTEKDPSTEGGDNPHEWSGLGRSGDHLFMDFPGETAGETLFAFKWLKVRSFRRDNIYGGMPFVRVEAAFKDKEMFVLLGVFLLSRIKKQAPGASAGSIVHQGLKDWERYMGQLTSPDVTKYTGALGELYVLLRLVRKNGVSAVGWWYGPDRVAQDFAIPTPQEDYAGLEVKTGGASDTTIQVNGLRQLLSPGILLRVALGPSDLPGELCSVGSLVKELEAKLVKDNESLAMFRDKMSKLALDTENSEYSSSRCVVGVSHWDMAELPKLYSRGPREDSVVSVRWTVELPQGSSLAIDCDLAALAGSAARSEQLA